MDLSGQQCFFYSERNFAKNLKKSKLPKKNQLNQLNMLIFSKKIQNYRNVCKLGNNCRNITKLGNFSKIVKFRTFVNFPRLLRKYVKMM